MLEILGITLLCKKNRKNALARGRKPGGFIALTICLWLGLEFIGGFIGAAADMGAGSYLLAIGMALLGGLISYLIAKNCKPGDYKEPENDAKDMEKTLEKVTECPSCGAPVKDGGIVCEYCGQNLTSAVSAGINKGVQKDKNSTASFVDPKPMRAVWTGLILVGVWILTVALHCIPKMCLVYCAPSATLITSALLGVGVYLLLQKGAKWKIFAAVAFVFAALLGALNYPVNQNIQVLLGEVDLGKLFRSPTFGTFLPVCLVESAIAAGCALLFGRLFRNRDENKRLWLTGLCTALVLLAACYIFRIIKSGRILTEGFNLIDYTLTYLLSALTVFFAVPSLGSLANLPDKRIHLKGWGLVWCCIGAAGMLAACILGIVSACEFSRLMYSIQLIFSVFALSGFILLICRRRIGWYFILFGAFIALVGQFKGSFILTLVRSERYYSLLIGSILGALNPVITWLSIRRAWKTDKTEE